MDHKIDKAQLHRGTESKAKSVVDKILGEGMDDADDGEHLEISGPKEATNQSAELADAIQDAAERLAGFIDRRANAYGEKLEGDLAEIHVKLTDLLEMIEAQARR